MKQPLIFIVCLLLWAGCTTEKAANNWFDRHPQKDAERCAKNYPVKDSAGETKTSYKAAENENYREIIDRLTERINDTQAHANDLADQLAARHDNDSLGACQQVLARYQANIAELKRQMNILKASYKPCIPDTVDIEKIIYRENTAKIAAQQMEIGQLTRDKNRANKDADRLRWYVIVLAPLLAISIFLHFKK